jgi:glycosyltransferase involved in cell wall biosynthesis
MPMRDEEGRLEPSVRSVLAQRGLSRREILVYDDDSQDGTAAAVTAVAGDAAVVLTGGALPPGWLGKTHACQQLADAAAGTVLVFVDADVVLAPDAIAGAVSVLRDRGLAFVSPYPRQLAGTWLERLVQPLLQWSWLSFLPLRLAERSSRASLAAANGQFLVVDAAMYARAGGHEVIRDDVVDDMALARVLVGVGGHGTFIDGHDIAVCRMYDGARPLAEGYAKSLWRAFGSPVGAVLVTVVMVILAVLPWALVAVTPAAWPAAVGGPAGRLVAAARTGSRPLWDAALHPLSVLAFACLVGISITRRRKARLTWKSRPLP